MYKIGDKVIYQGADKAAYKREGIVVSVEITNGKQQLTVELDGGEYFTAPIDDWSRKFDNSARNAKLAVGDKVRVWQYPIRGQYGKVVKVGLMEYDVEVAGKVYPKIDYRYVVKMPAANACASTNSVVRNAMAAHGVARNSVEVEVSLMYAGRVQHAMRDAARSVSGVRVTGTNTLYCPDEDAADEVVDILEQAGVPKREISLNAKRVARNAMQDAGSYVRECNKFIPEANAMIREWDAFYKKMTAKRKWYDSKMTELRDGFYRIDKGDPDYDKARAAYDALRDVSRSAEAVHLFYSV